MTEAEDQNRGNINGGVIKPQKRDKHRLNETQPEPSASHAANRFSKTDTNENLDLKKRIISTGYNIITDIALQHSCARETLNHIRGEESLEEYPKLL